MAVCRWCNQEMSDLKIKTCWASSEVEFPEGIKMDAVPFYPYNLSIAQQKELADMRPEYVAATGIIDDGILSPSHGKRCHDCNVAVGGFHHPGCDNERCPKCHGQLISCGCLEE